MAKGIVARKLGMTQVFDAEGRSVPVTVLRAGPCFVTQLKTEDRDKYEAVQLGFERIRPALKTKAEIGHLKKNNMETFRILREFRDMGLDLQLGQEVNASIFQKGEIVKVSGISKGKGFQGTIKRYGFARGRMTHGSKFHRAPGSGGASAYPSRVFKGKRYAGQTGAKEITTSNLEIMEIDPVNHLVMIRGSVPGPRTALIRIEAMKT